MAALRVPNGGKLSRREIDLYSDFVGRYGAKGLAYIKVNDVSQGREGLQAPIVKFLPDEILAKKKLTAPACWKDLIKPEFAGEVQMANPNASGTAYTAIATFGKFALGFWLALLLNNHFPFKSLLRAIVLLPWIVPTVLSALAFWWIYDPQFSIISYLLVDVLGWRSTNIDFLGSPWPARFSLIAANIWRGIPFVAISLLAGLQTISPSLYEAAMLDGASSWQRFRYITFPMMMPILAIVMTFSIIFTFTDFQLVYAITRGGPVNSTHLLATLAFQRGIAGGELGEGAAIAVSMIPFLVFATLFSYFGLARRKWQQGEAND